MMRRQEIREHLARMVDSEQFVTSRSVTRLLTYCVNAALSGEEETLKETTIGISCFGRTPGYDTKQDPIVRVTARRLRSKLDLYYQCEAGRGGLRILFPKGTYVPRFDYRAPAAAAMPRAEQEPAGTLPQALAGHAEDTAAVEALPVRVEYSPALARGRGLGAPALGFLGLALVVLGLWIVPQTHLLHENGSSRFSSSGSGDAAASEEPGGAEALKNAGELVGPPQPETHSDPVRNAADTTAGGQARPMVARTNDLAASVEPRL